jgi:gluconate 2-dehydrogenase alpha chain
MMLSGIGEIYNPATGEGLVGKNYCYQVMSGVDVFYEDKYTNQFVGAGALGMASTNITATISITAASASSAAATSPAGRPTRARSSAPHAQGTPTWGAKWKKAVADNFLKSTGLSVRTAPRWPMRATISTSIPPTRTPTAVRLCA